MDESDGHGVGEQLNLAELLPTEGKKTAMNSSSGWRSGSRMSISEETNKGSR